MSSLAIIGGVLGGIVTLIVGIYTARMAHRNAVTAPYKVLSDEVGDLRVEVRDLSRQVRGMDDDLDTAVDALWEQQVWIESGAVPPPPTITSRALQVVHRRRAERAESHPPTGTEQED